MWNCCQIVIAKVLLTLVGSVYLFTSAYLFVANPVITGDKTFDTSLRDLYITLAIAQFAYFAEVYQKISDVDGTNGFDSDYVMCDEQENKEENLAIE